MIYPAPHQPKHATLALAVGLSFFCHLILVMAWPQSDAPTPPMDDPIAMEISTSPSPGASLAANTPAPPEVRQAPPAGTPRANRQAQIKRYLIRLRKRIEAAKFIPRQDGDNAMIGNVLIGFDITGNGAFKNIRVLRSSGFPRLDKKADHAVRRSCLGIKRPGATGTERIRTSVVIKYQYGL